MRTFALELIDIFKRIFNPVCACVCICVWCVYFHVGMWTWVQVPVEIRDTGLPGAGVTGNIPEWLEGGAGNQTWVLWKSSKCS